MNGRLGPYPSIVLGVPCEYIRQHVDHCHSHAYLEKREMRTVTVIQTPFFHQVNSSFSIIEDDHLAMKYTQEHNISYGTCLATQSHILELRNTYHIASTTPQFYPLDFLEEYIVGDL